MIAELPRTTHAAIVLPIGVAKRLCDRAQEEFGPDGEAQIDTYRTQIVLWLGGRSQFMGQRRGRPAGAFWIRWQAPIVSQATIERLGWDPSMGGSEAEVREVIDALAGWPVASRMRIA